MEVEDDRLSLLTISLLYNNTTNNQGNHCTVAISLGDVLTVIDCGNQSLTRSADYCQGKKDTIRNDVVELLASWLGIS